MTSWLYWLGFGLVAALVLAGPWICAELDERADDRDAELWMQMPGATR